MGPFKNKDVDETGMPPEVHQFYQAEHRERVGVAWLLAFATLVITVGVALGAFSGGRAFYRKIVKKDKNTPTTQVATKASNTSSASTASPSPSNQAANTATPTPPKPAPAPKPATKPSSPAPSSAAPTTTPSTTSKPTTPNTHLTDTGPGDTVALFMGVTLLATFGHMIYTRYRQAKHSF